MKNTFLLRLCCKPSQGQTALEYLIMLGVLAVIALTAFRTMIPMAFNETNLEFTRGALNIMGNKLNPNTLGPFL